MKVTRDVCSEPYPDELEFRENGLYIGSKGAGEFTIWDVGEFERRSDSEVMISTANDVHIVYRYELSEDVLSFEDADGCRFRYRRA